MMRPMLACAMACLALLMAGRGHGAPASAPHAPAAIANPPRADGPLQQRANQALGLIAEKPDWPKDMFAPSFTRQVGDAQLRAIGAQYFAKNGGVRELQRTSSQGEFAGTFDLIMEKGTVVRMTLAVSDKAPHQVTGLVFGLPSPMLKSLDEAVAEFRKLPGTVSFGAWKLVDGAPQPMAQLNADQSLALGSAFKLFVLGALADDIRAGRRHLSDVVTLQSSARSLPSGQMQSWPDGSPATLATLASLMISISDNTATDALIDALGRERVEAAVAAMGVKEPARDRPFLKTAEMFRLKFTDGGKMGDAYAGLDEAGRRAMLAKGLGTTPLSMESLDPGAFEQPARIDSIEWFASASDLARAMAWLSQATEGATGSQPALLRGALAINRGLDISAKQFPWVGFKGGSEPGVINLTFLLRSASGDWFVLAATWNDPEKSVDEQAFAAIVQRAIWVLGNSALPASDKAPTP